MTRWQIIRLLLIVAYRVIVKRDYLGLLRHLLPKENPLATEPMKPHPSAMSFVPELRKMVRGGGNPLIVLLLCSGIAMAAGQITVTGFPPVPVTIKGGAGIDIAGGVITATGVPAGGVSDAAFKVYTSVGGGRATNDRVDAVQEQVTAQAVGSALGTTAVQQSAFDIYSTAQAAQDAAQDSAIAGKEPSDSTIIKESELSSATNSTSTTTAANSAAVKAAYDLAAGKVSGAASSTDNAVARFDGTTGKIIQNSALILNDSGKTSVSVANSSGTDPSGTPVSYQYNTTAALSSKTWNNAWGYQQYLSGDGGGRTQSMVNYVNAIHTGYGDGYVDLKTMYTVPHAGSASVTAWSGQNSGGLFNGESNAGGNKVNVYGLGDIAMSDNGYSSVGMLGTVFIQYRSGADGTYNVPRQGFLASSRGSLPLDGAYSANGKYGIGFDATGLIGDISAFSMASGQKFSLAASAPPSGKYTSVNAGSSYIRNSLSKVEITANGDSNKVTIDGSGNVNIPSGAAFTVNGSAIGGGAWGSITGTLNNQTDLQTALSAKESTANKGVANGYASLGSTGQVPITQLASGTPDGTKFIRDDGTLATPPTSGSSSFASLTDAFSLAGQGGKVVQVNAGGTALEPGQSLGTTSTATFGAVNIGTDATVTALHVRTNGTPSATFVSERISADTAAGAFLTRKARGTLAAPSKVQAGDLLGTFSFAGWHNGTTPGYANGAQLSVYAQETPADGVSQVKGYMDFLTNNGTSNTVRMRLTQDGNVGIGTTSPGEKLDVAGNIKASGTITAKLHAATIPAATTYGSTSTVDLSAGVRPSLTLTGNTTIAFSNPVIGSYYNLLVKQDATGSRTVTWPSTGLVCTWIKSDYSTTTTGPTMPTAANSVLTTVILPTSSTTADCWAAGY